MERKRGLVSYWFLSFWCMRNITFVIITFVNFFSLGLKLHFEPLLTKQASIIISYWVHIKVGSVIKFFVVLFVLFNINVLFFEIIWKLGLRTLPKRLAIVTLIQNFQFSTL